MSDYLSRDDALLAAHKMFYKMGVGEVPIRSSRELFMLYKEEMLKGENGLKGSFKDIVLKKMNIPYDREQELRKRIAEKFDHEGAIDFLAEKRFDLDARESISWTIRLNDGIDTIDKWNEFGDRFSVLTKKANLDRHLNGMDKFVELAANESVIPDDMKDFLNKLNNRINSETQQKKSSEPAPMFLESKKGTAIKRVMNWARLSSE